MSKNISELIKAGHPQRQSVAISYSVCEQLKNKKNEKKKKR